MQTYGVNELRKMFLDFFESKEHLVHKSFPWCRTTIRVCCSSIPGWHH